MDGINAEMKQAEKHITGMEKWCGLCVCPWNRTRKIKDKDGVWRNPDEDDKKGKKDKKKPPVDKQPGAGAATADGGPYIRRINNDAREDEMEDNMVAVGNMLGNLKSMAQDMGDEIGKQNTQIDRVTAKSQSADVRINSANKRTEKLLK